MAVEITAFFIGEKMTVPVSDRLSQLYVGNGTNVRFDFNFRVFQQEDDTGIAVRQKGLIDFETLDPSMYTVTVNQDGMGGYITFSVPPNAGVYFYIAGLTTLDQLLDITNYDNFYPDAIERALDKLTALLQERSTEIDLEKQARILADIHYDSLAMERESNLENRLISYINAMIGITNPAIFDGISDRMIITQDGRTQREFNASIPFWTNDYVSFKQETYLREEQILDHTNESVEQVQSSLNSEIQDETLRAQMQEQFLQNQISAIGVGNRSYKTYAEMDADKVNIPSKSKVTVTNDPTSSNNGDWQWDGSIFTKSIYDPLNQAINYTDQKVTTINNSVDLKKSDDPTIVPLLVDAAGYALAYYDKTKECFYGAGLLDSIFDRISALKQYEDDQFIPGAVDKNGRILWGWDKVNDQFFGADNAVAQQKKYQYFTQKPLTLAVNHVLSYGQSLSMGATATTLLSTTQPYFNTTFNSGPRQDTAATSIIPLVEQFNNPSVDGYTNRGETHCSGLANFASSTMMKENGVDPSSHVIFASTAGHGGYTIDQLKKGSGWYSVLLDHVTKAKNLNAGKTYHVPVVPWIQGENNAVTGGLQTPYSTYKSALAQLQIDVNADIKAITAQVDQVRFITYQMSYAAKTWPDIAKAQFDLARENDNFMLATPMYHFPYASDNIHLTNVGYKWMGAYFGRAYKQYMIDGRKPDFINPLYAYIEKDKVFIKFDVPKLPLLIDTTALAQTTNAGFKVVNGSTEILISSVTATNDMVILQLASTPSSALQVRYALDYLGTGLTITDGASGNLRDSTKDKVEISGVVRPLFHVCPHFEITANLNKGI